MLGLRQRLRRTLHRVRRLEMRTSLKAILCGAALLVVSACGQVLSREDLTTAVMGKSEQEVTQQLGKPDAVDDSDPEHVTWTYRRKTFDLAHENKVDSKTIVLFEGGSTEGERHVARVEFSS
jgi:hypothetical protein